MSRATFLGTSLFLLVTVLSAVAMWYDVLEVNSVIRTGEVDVVFSGYEVVEGYEYGKPWVADCTAKLREVEDEDLDNPSGDNDLDLSITVSNAYPGYSCTIYFRVRNTGTVPVVGPFYELLEVPEGLEVAFEPRLAQLHPGDEVEYSIHLEVLQEAEQGATYELQVHLKYIQWNEVVVRYATISGYVFHDVDGSRTWDPGEDPLPSVLIELYDDGGNLVGTYRTGDDGYYEFTVYPPTARQYTIVAYALPNYYFTTPSTLYAIVWPGSSSTGNDFGLKQLPPQPELGVSKEFRETDVDFSTCPAKLGTPLSRIEVTVPDQGANKGKILNVNPGAFFGIIRISGEGITEVRITDTYDFHFDVEDGIDGKVRVYLLDSSGCVTELAPGSYSYTVDNENNVVTVDIDLDRPLGAGETILVYLKFKPAPGLVGSYWESLTDRWFDNSATVETNIGSSTASASIELVKK